MLELLSPSESFLQWYNAVSCTMTKPYHIKSHFPFIFFLIFFVCYKALRRWLAHTSLVKCIRTRDFSLAQSKNTQPERNLLNKSMYMKKRVPSSETNLTVSAVILSLRRGPSDSTSSSFFLIWNNKIIEVEVMNDLDNHDQGHMIYTT